MTPTTDQPLRQPRSLACLGDAADIQTWSNIPYYLFQAGKANGFLTDALNTMDPDYRLRRLGWMVRSRLKFERGRGYQYSEESCRRMWSLVPEHLRRGEIISHFQLFPPLRQAKAAGVRHSFYCDSTLKQLFDYNKDQILNARLRVEAIEREKELYHAAKFVIAMAHATADVVVREYGVDRSKVFAVRAGANLDEDAVRDYLDQRGPSWRLTGARFAFTRENPAQLGFIGRDYVRKGLPRLIAAAEILNRRGRFVRVTTIGVDSDELAAHPLVNSIGLLDKRTQTRQFMETVDRFAIGCLPSYFEPLGISTLEALRLGVPVMGTAVGGIPDCVPEGAGFIVPAAATPEVIADELESHVFDAARYQTMAQAAQDVSETVTWQETVRQLEKIWAGTSPAGANAPANLVI